MPITFSLLPEHIGVSIVQKMELNDFVNFHGSSRVAYLTSKAIKTRFVTAGRGIYSIDENVKGFYLTRSEECHADVLENLPIQLKIQCLICSANFSEAECEWVINFHKKTNSSTDDLEFEETKITCSPEYFNRLIEATKVKEITNIELKSPDFLAFPNINKIDALLASCFINDSLFLTLMMPVIKIYSSNISNEGLNVFLKEWVNGQRRITFTDLTYRNVSDKDIVFKDITTEYLNLFEDHENAYKVRNIDGDEIVVYFEKYAINIRDIKANVNKYLSF